MGCCPVGKKTVVESPSDEQKVNEIGDGRTIFVQSKMMNFMANQENLPIKEGKYESDFYGEKKVLEEENNSKIGSYFGTSDRNNLTEAHHKHINKEEKIDEEVSDNDEKSHHTIDLEEEERRVVNYSKKSRDNSNCRSVDIIKPKSSKKQEEKKSLSKSSLESINIDDENNNNEKPNRNIIQLQNDAKQEPQKRGDFTVVESKIQPQFKRGECSSMKKFKRVYQCLQMNRGGLCAVKTFSLGATASRQEVVELIDYIIEVYNYVAQQISHKYLVKYFGAQRSFDMPDCQDIISEYIPGCLSTLLQQFGAFDERRSSKYLKQVIDAKRFLHDNELTCANLKASNVLTDREGTVKLCDYVCYEELKMLEDTLIEDDRNTKRFKDACDYGYGVEGSNNNSDDSADPFTKDIGALYQAPEVVLDLQRDEIEEESDVWSIGCLTYELLTTKPPYYDQTNGGDLSLLRYILSKEELPFIDLKWSIECQAFLRKCFCFQPNKRPQQAQLAQDPFIMNIPDDDNESESSGTTAQNGRWDTRDKKESRMKNFRQSGIANKKKSIIADLFVIRNKKLSRNKKNNYYPENCIAETNDEYRGDNDGPQHYKTYQGPQKKKHNSSQKIYGIGEDEYDNKSIDISGMNMNLEYIPRGMQNDNPFATVDPNMNRHSTSQNSTMKFDNEKQKKSFREMGNSNVSIDDNEVRKGNFVEQNSQDDSEDDIAAKQREFEMMMQGMMNMGGDANTKNDIEIEEESIEDHGEEDIDAEQKRIEEMLMGFMDNPGQGQEEKGSFKGDNQSEEQSERNSNDIDDDQKRMEEMLLGFMNNPGQGEQSKSEEESGSQDQNSRTNEMVSNNYMHGDKSGIDYYNQRIDRSRSADIVEEEEGERPSSLGNKSSNPLSKDKSGYGRVISSRTNSQIDKSNQNRQKNEKNVYIDYKKNEDDEKPEETEDYYAFTPISYERKQHKHMLEVDGQELKPRGPKFNFGTQNQENNINSSRSRQSRSNKTSSLNASYDNRSNQKKYNSPKKKVVINVNRSYKKNQNGSSSSLKDRDQKGINCVRFGDGFSQKISDISMESQGNNIKNSHNDIPFEIASIKKSMHSSAWKNGNEFHSNDNSDLQYKKSKNSPKRIQLKSEAGTSDKRHKKLISEISENDSKYSHDGQCQENRVVYDGSNREKNHCGTSPSGRKISQSIKEIVDHSSRNISKNSKTHKSSFDKTEVIGSPANSMNKSNKSPPKNLYNTHFTFKASEGKLGANNSHCRSGKSSNNHSFNIDQNNDKYFQHDNNYIAPNQQYLQCFANPNQDGGFDDVEVEAYHNMVRPHSDRSNKSKNSRQSSYQNLHAKEKYTKHNITHDDHMGGYNDYEKRSSRSSPKNQDYQNY